MATIRPLQDAWELEVKRFYVPFTIVDDCRRCNREVTWNPRGWDYLSYPRLNTRESVCLYCASCDLRWQVEVILTLDVQLVGAKKTEG